MARNQVIDLRRNFQPQQKSPIVSGLEGLMSGFNQQSQAIQKQKNTSQALEGLGFAREESEALSRLPEPVLLNVMKQLSERGYSGAPQGGASQGGSPQMQQIEQMFNANESSPTQDTLQGMSDQLRMPEGMRKLGMENQQPFQQQQMQQQQQPFQQQQPKTAAEALRMQPRREQREEQKLAIQERKVLGQEKAQERQAIREAYKDTAPYRTKVLEAQKESQNVMSDLDRFKALESEDAALDTPGYYEFLKRSGLDIPALMKPESEEFIKIRQSFLRDAKTIFGGRVTNFEMEQFLKAIPDLSMSPEGRKRVIANMEKLNRLKIKEGDIMRKVIKANKNVPPADLQEQVTDQLEKEREKISEQFKKDLKRPVPASQNRLVTASQAILGSILGAPGTALGGIGKLLGGAL